MINIGSNGGLTVTPYSSSTKRTKIITISSTSFLTVTGTNITGNTILGAYMYAYADSTGKWRLNFNFHCPVTSTGVRGTANFTLLSTYAVTFKNGIYQAVASFLGQTGNSCTARTTSNSSIIALLHTSSNENEYQVSGDVELESEPTWAAANMEGVLAADVYIPSAAAGIAGLVDNTAGNTVGTPIKGRTDGGAVAAGYVGEKITWVNPPNSVIGATNTSATDWANAYITLSKGEYQIFAQIPLLCRSTAVLGNYSAASIAITNSAGGVVGDFVGSISIKTPAAAIMDVTGSVVFSDTYTATADNTVLKLRYFMAAGSGLMNVFNENLLFAKFYAIRIA